MPYILSMQTVVEIPEYLAAAKRAGMTDDEREAVVSYIAANPQAGDIMPDTGGCRKVRIAKGGKGKSGGYRVVTYYANEDEPVYLMTVISKGKQANLTQKQKNELRKGKAK